MGGKAADAAQDAGRIRLARPDDAARLLEIYAPSILHSAVSFELELPTEAQFAARVAHTLARYPWLVLELDGRIAGYAYGTEHRERPAYRWSVETSVYVGSEFYRRGVGRALYAALFALLKHQGFCNALAGTTLPNPGSVALHQAVGFTSVGSYRRIGFKQGRWHDVQWWERRLDASEAPRPPRPLSEIETSEIDVILARARGLQPGPA